MSRRAPHEGMSPKIMTSMRVVMSPMSIALQCTRVARSKRWASTTPAAPRE